MLSTRRAAQLVAALIIFGAVGPALWLARGWRLILRILERKARATLGLPRSAGDAAADAEAARLVESPGPDLPGATHESVPASDPAISLHVVRLDPPTGVARTGRIILFVHGFPEFWAAWAPSMAGLAADGHVCAALDMRGFGDSHPKPPGVEHYGIGALAADVVGVANHLRGGDGSKTRVTLVGHDWGGQVAGHAAALGGAGVFDAAALLCIPYPGGAFLANAGLRQAARSWYILFFQCPWLGLGEELMFGGAARTLGGIVAERRAEAEALAEDDKGRAAAVEAAAGLSPAPPLLTFSHAVEDAGFRAAFLRDEAAQRATVNYYRSLVRSALGIGPHPATRAQAAAFKARLRSPGSFPVPLLMLYAARDVALGPELLAGADAYAPDLEVHMLDCSHWAPAARPREVIARLRAFVKRTGTA
jgi:epoxide hydrolase 4